MFGALLKGAMGERQPQLERGAEEIRRPPTRREILREEWDIPAESDRLFNVGLAIIVFAAGVGIAVIPLDDPVVQASLGTLAACLLVVGVACLFLNREVNRGRRPRRSRVIEETVD